MQSDFRYPIFFFVGWETFDSAIKQRSYETRYCIALNFNQTGKIALIMEYKEMATIAEIIESKQAEKEAKKAIVETDDLNGIKTPDLNADEALALVDNETAKIAYYAAFAEMGFRYTIRPQKDVSAMIADFGMLLLGMKEASNGKPITVKDGEQKFTEFKKRFAFWAELLSRLIAIGEYVPPESDEDKLVKLLKLDLATGIERAKEAGYSLTAITNALQSIAMGK